MYPFSILLIRRSCFTLQEWPNDALEAVAIKFLTQMDLEEDTRQSIVLICKVPYSTSMSPIQYNVEHIVVFPLIQFMKSVEVMATWSSHAA